MDEKNKKSSDILWVLNVAQLARIELNKREEKKFADQLGAVFSNFELLNKIDTTNVEATSQITGLSNIFREDEVKNPVGKKIRNDLLLNCPQVENGLIKVPEVFDFGGEK